MVRLLRSIGCVAVLLVTSCGARGDTGSIPFGQSCTAGQTEDCVCEATMNMGARSCGIDLRFTACVCDGVDAGAVAADDLGSVVRDVPLSVDRGVLGTDIPAVGLDRGVTTGPGTFGTPCTQLAQCASGVCLPTGRCSRTCSGAADCPSTIGWTCTALPGLGPVCGCTPRGVEICNGLDDDCDGVPDTAITPRGSVCVDPPTDAANSGASGIPAAAGPPRSGWGTGPGGGTRRARRWVARRTQCRSRRSWRHRSAGPRRPNRSG